MRRLLPVPLILTAALGLAACGDDSTVSSDTTTTSTSDTTSTAASTPQTTSTAAPETLANGCKKVDAPQPKTVDVQKPTGTLPKGKAYTVVLKTSCGEIDIRLDTKEDPKTSASFAALVRAGFFDGLSFHRVAPGFVIQGGDPNGDGSGGPDYSVVEAPPRDTRYLKGVVAMAKTATEAPGTSGSQFFIVTGEDIGLPPEYAVLGKVVKGQKVADTIGAIQPVDPASGQPTQDGTPSTPVVIESATLKTS